MNEQPAPRKKHSWSAVRMARGLMLACECEQDSVKNYFCPLQQNLARTFLRRFSTELRTKIVPRNGDEPDLTIFWKEPAAAHPQALQMRASGDDQERARRRALLQPTS